MNKFLFLTIVVILVWGFSFVNPSGLGQMYDSSTKMFWLIGLWYLFSLRRRVTSLPYNGRNRELAFFTIFSFILLPLVVKGSWEGFTYLLTVPFVFCFAQKIIGIRFINISAYIVAGLGGVILLIYSRSEILSGWNDNAISMYGLFSFLYYSICLYGSLSKKEKYIGLAISVFFIYVLMNATNSRSGIIFIFLSVFMAYRGAIYRSMLMRRKFLILALNVPLFIALVVILLPNITLFQYLDQLSQQNFDKPLFNGRDILWLEAFQQLSHDYFLGAMEFKINYHNSAVAALAVFGVIGYICWYKILYRSLHYMQFYLCDDIVLGCFMAFILIYWQQSFDLGFISASPNMLPYAILGIGLGRVNTLRRYAKSKCHSTRL